MIRLPIAITLVASIVAAHPAPAATRTADAARVAAATLSPIARPVRIALRPASVRRPRYELPRMMARNFGTVGQRQLDLLVASIQ